jgi:chromosome partitioning protein
VALSYYRQSPAGLQAAGPGAVGLGWPEEPLPGRVNGVAGAGTGGLGWPESSGGRKGPSSPPDAEDRKAVSLSSGLISSAQDAGQESRGIQVNQERSGAGNGEVRGTPGVPGAAPQEPFAIDVSRKTNPVVVPEIPADPLDTPIARAAQAAVVGRGKGQSWPRPSRCRIMTIANQKGGVGKTTTAVNLAASLAQHGSRVLVIDLDPQGNASTALDVEHHVGVPSVYDVLVDNRPLAEVVRPAGDMPGLYCAPATIDLAGAEIELVPVVARELRLARALKDFDISGLDYVLVDCPPSLGLLTLNALVAAEEVLLPIQCEYYALEGVQQLLNTAELVRVNFNPGLHVSTVLLTMFDGRTRLASDVADDVRAHFGTSVLSTIIPRSVRVSEAPSRGQSVIAYDPASSGAIAYTEAARELAMNSAGARQSG